jgi:tetratricopeptide (TPR) repeat protein
MILFDEVRQMVEDTDLDQELIKHDSGLSFLKAYLDSPSEAIYFIKKTRNKIMTGKLNSVSWGYAYYYLGRAYQCLGETELSLDMYGEAIKYAERNLFPQLKARTLCGLAQFERKEGDFDLALQNNIEAIKLLEKIGALPDLAEAYYEFGLTQKVVGNIEKSNESFQEAIRLFSEMGAPKQVERVRKSMENEK